MGSGIAVYFNTEHQKVSTSFMFYNISVAVWSFGYFLMITANSYQVALLSNYMLHIGAIIIPVLYFYFITALTDSYDRYKNILPFFVFLVLSFLFLNLSDLFIKDVVPKYIFNFAPDAGSLYILFPVFFFSIIFFSLYILINTIIKTSHENSIRLIFILIASIAGFVGGGSVFFLTFNVNIPPYPLVLFTFYPVVITYAILRHNLFDVKVIATELLTFALWATILFRTILSTNTEDQIINLTFLIISIILGIFLIRSVIKEVEAREQIEKLAKDLEAANVRLKELDQLKSEFVSIASHQLRSPLTAIKGYASLILEGSFGKAPPAVGEAVGKILDSSSRLVLIIEDFLNLSRIEQGRMKYDFAPTDIEAMVKSVVDELLPTIKTAGLSISFTTDNQPPYKSNLDVGKIKQVIGNIIDNSIKYTPRGSIEVSLKKMAENRLLITVSDTGIGISKETLPTLFEKFSRAKDASKTNTTGTGLGLYVAKQMVEAHGGKIWAESDGVGKGSRFKVELKGIR